MARLSRFLAFLIGAMVAATVSAGAFVVSSEPLVVETAGGRVTFKVELALTPAQRATGLMDRTSMALDHGMLFVFEETRTVSMWMKNTVLALDMVFIDATGKVAGIAANTKPFSESIIISPGPVKYVLELNAGVAAEKGIAAGDRVSHPAMQSAAAR